MTKHVLLNNVEHRDLRVITQRRADLGDDLMYALTFPAEFRNLQVCYPIVFAKSPEGKFLPLALFGFRDKQNLFLNGTDWDAPYVPMMVDRVPFLIGNGPNGKVVHIDLDNPHVSRTDGERLFLEHGGNSEFLDKVSRLMGTIDEGVEATPGFIAALEELKLLESFTLDIQLNDGAVFRFTGFHSIHEERLAKLDGPTLARLHERGYLQAIFMAIASVSNFRFLIDRVNKLNAADR